MNPEEYRKLADVEDRMWYFRALHRHVDRELTAALGDDNHRILDAGCGTGGLVARLRSWHPGWTWTGIDLSELACGLARRRLAVEPAHPGRRGEPVEIHQGSVTALPFGDEAFDAVVSADVLYHVDDDAAALREAGRVLRRGGIIVINVPAYPWLWSYHDVAVHSRRRYYRAEVVAKVRAAGLVPVRATYWNTLPFPLVVARRKLLPAPADGSDVHVFAAPIETAFDAAMAAERGWLRVVGRLPCGSSVFVVARKP